LLFLWTGGWALIDHNVRGVRLEFEQHELLRMKGLRWV
jgi:hypothetical protein